MDETKIALRVRNNQGVIGTISTTSSYKRRLRIANGYQLLRPFQLLVFDCKPWLFQGPKPSNNLVYFKGQSLQTTWFINDTTPNYQYTVSMNGWTNNEIGLAWLNQVFLPQTAVGFLVWSCEFRARIWRSMLSI